MKKITYKTRRSLHRILTVLLIVGMALALFSFCWNIWVARYVVYTRDGATLDFTRGPLPDNAVIAQQPKADENVSIYYNEGSDAVELSQELSSVNGYYIDYDVLKQGNFEEIKTDLNRLKAGTAIMIELKGGYGSFYYTSGLTGAVSSASVNTTAVDELIQYVRSKGFYMIAKISAFRDYDFGNRNVTSGLYMKSRAGLWADSGGCYWMDPTSANTLGWITSIVNEVHSLGFSEVVLDNFRFPAETDKYIFNGSMEEAITSAATTCFWKDCRINIIDTPGHVDFTAEVERCLRVLDGAVAVFDAVAGVQPQSETVWRQASTFNVPRIAFINKYDRVGADFFNAIETMKDRLDANAVAAQVPMGAEDNFWGVIDLVTMTAWDFKADEKGMTYPEPMDEIPAEFADIAATKREELLDAAASFDDELMEKILMEEDFTVEELKAALRKGVLANELNLVFVGSAYKNKGVQELLDAVVDYLPSPLDVEAVTGTDPDTGEEIQRHPSFDEPFSGLVFKIMTDPFVGKLYYFRVYSGVAAQGMSVLNPRTGKRERLGRLLQMHANQREEHDEIFSGDIAAAVGLKNVTTGDTICLEDDPIVLESMSFPEPVISIAVEPKSSGDRDKLTKGLIALSDEDPTFQIHSDEETGQTIISGMGELHLEIILDRLVREFKVEANTGAPQVAYREALCGPADSNTKFVRQSGGRGQYGHCIINLIPGEGGSGVVFLLLLLAMVALACFNIWRKLRKKTRNQY